MQAADDVITFEIVTTGPEQRLRDKRSVHAALVHYDAHGWPGDYDSYLGAVSIRSGVPLASVESLVHEILIEAMRRNGMR